MALWELMAPRRILTVRKIPRWGSNLGLVVFNTVLLRLFVPLNAVATAIAAEAGGWGLLNLTTWPPWLELLIAVMILDLAVFLQHVMFHFVPQIVVLLTDGDNNAGKVTPVFAAEAAKVLGIKVYTVGAGTRGYAPVPVQDPYGRTVYQNVKVEVDEKTLTEIATMTNAQYFRATDNKSLEEIFGQIDKLEKSTVEMDQYKQYRDLFPWFLGPGFALIALEVLLGQTIWRRLP